MILLLGVYLKETIIDIDNDLSIRKEFKFPKAENNYNKHNHKSSQIKIYPHTEIQYSY